MNIPDNNYIHLLGEMPERLVFIMGLHRSGTSILHKMLSATGYFSYITAYDIINYDSLLSDFISGKENEKKEKIGKKLSVSDNREIDNIKTGANEPEEYGFLLPKSNEQHYFSNKLCHESLPKFKEICMKKKYLGPENHTLVLKNPSDFDNFSFIAENLPNSIFVFIHRHPLMVIDSQIKAWQNVLENSNKYFSELDSDIKKISFSASELKKYKAMLELSDQNKTIMEIFNMAYNRHMKYLTEISPNRYIELRYEDLCNQTDKTYSKLCRFLGITYSEEITSFIRTGKREIKPETITSYSRYAKKMRHYLTYMNYEKFPRNIKDYNEEQI